MKTAIATVILLGSTLATYAHLGALTLPKAGETYTAGQVLPVKWTVPTQHNTIDLAYSQDGKTWTTITTGLARSVTTYNWTVPDKASATTRFRVCQRDGASVQGCTDTHNTQSLSAGIQVTGGEVYTAITGNFTITSGPNSLQAAPAFSGASLAFRPESRSVEAAFTLSAPERVTLEAFNAQGKRLAVLLDDKKAEGRHVLSVFSHALDVTGPMILRLQAGDKVLQQALEGGR